MGIADEADRTLFVGNLDPQVTEEVIFELFLQVSVLASLISLLMLVTLMGCCCFGPGPGPGPGPFANDLIESSRCMFYKQARWCRFKICMT